MQVKDAISHYTNSSTLIIRADSKRLFVGTVREFKRKQTYEWINELEVLRENRQTDRSLIIVKESEGEVNEEN